MKTAGILGGMGPLATVDFMKKVIESTPASRDQDHVPMLVHSVPQIPDRTTAILHGGEDPLPALVAGARKLEQMGADFVAIPCNTAHNWHSGVQEQVGIPVLHIVDATVDKIREGGITGGPVGVLATSGTIAAGVYTHRLEQKGYTPVFPSEQDQAKVTEGIAAVKGGDVETGRQRLGSVARTLLNDQGCSTVILGCTEIPVALENEPELLARSVDATDALAKKTVEVARSQDRTQLHSSAQSSRQEPGFPQTREALAALNRSSAARPLTTRTSSESLSRR